MSFTHPSAGNHGNRGNIVLSVFNPQESESLDSITLFIIVFRGPSGNHVNIIGRWWVATEAFACMTSVIIHQNT